MDEALLHFFNRPGNEALDAIMIALSSRLVLLAVLAAACGWLWLRTRAKWRAALLLCIAVAAADAGGARILKPFFARHRPCADKIAVAIQGCGRGRSFPSNHASTIAAGALTFALFAPALAVPAALLAIAVGISRVYLGQHWPSDVMAGWIFGAAIALLLFAVARFIARGTRQDFL